MKKINDDVVRALESCYSALSLPELSRVTGIRLELLRRFITKRTKLAREDTWDRIYPLLKPYLSGPEPEPVLPPRIGPGYRRHHDLVDMSSDQKILLDIFLVMSPEDRDKLVKSAVSEAEGCKPTEFAALTAQENRLMGA